MKALRLQSIDELLGPSATTLLANQDRLEAAVGEPAMSLVMNIETTQDPTQGRRGVAGGTEGSDLAPT